MDRKELTKRLRAEAEKSERPRPTPAAETGPHSDPAGYLAVVHMWTGFRTRGLVGTWLAMSVGATVAVAIAFDRGLLAVGFAVGALLVSVIPVILLIALIRFVPYRRWRSRLPFPVDGDFDILAADRSPSTGWRACQVAVDAPRPRDFETIQVALRALCSRANRSIYKTTWGMGITRWAVDKLVARGDANIGVAWKIYIFISQDLCALREAGVTIERVKIQASADANHVAAESDTSFYD